MQTQPLILIPARYGSSRFPGKPLAAINGKAMIDHVYDRCIETGWATFVVTDHPEIENHLNDGNRKVIRIDDEVATGSERIALAVKRNFDIEQYPWIINVQGDEPLLNSIELKNLVEFHKNNNFGITTLIKERDSKEDLNNPNIVKACWSKKSKACLYFSRAPIPFHREATANQIWWQHIGVYCYGAKELMEFVKLEPSDLEKCESLEQLRALENKITIGAITTNMDLIGVDTPEDIKKVEERLS